MEWMYGCRLKKVWKRSGKESDRLAYRAECRRANKLINVSRRDYNSRRINACSDSKSCWAAVRELLHSAGIPPTSTEEENIKLCNSFSNYFIIKITNLKQSIFTRLTSMTLPPVSNPIFNSVALSSPPPVSPDEVSNFSIHST